MPVTTTKQTQGDERERERILACQLRLQNKHKGDERERENSSMPVTTTKQTQGDEREREF